MFKKAERKKIKLRLAISGVSGSGKTFSALEIATGMLSLDTDCGNIGDIALIDTEGGRGNLYASSMTKEEYWEKAKKEGIENIDSKKFGFIYDINEISEPFHPQKYIDAIKDAEKSGYKILIIDSLSHAWFAEGGVLSLVDKAGGNFKAWGTTGTPMQNKLVSTIINSNLHIIFTMRSKADYVMETVTNKQGKEVQAPKKVGLAPVQREGLEYECTLYMEMNLDNVAFVSKDNTHIFSYEKYITPSKNIGIKLMEWLNSGKEIEDKKEVDWVEEIKLCKTIEELKYVVKQFNLEVKNFPGKKTLIESFVKEKEKKKKEIQDNVEKTSTQMGSDQ